MDSLKTGAIALGGLLVLIVLGYVLIFNGLVSAEQGVAEKWAQVETQYQRRVDLIPNLVSTVKGVSGFEQETLTKLSELRTQWQTGGGVAAKVNAANEIEATISKLLVVAESYPELTATQAYRDLMVQLEGTENRIAFVRGEYNLAVRDYNTRIKTIPGSFVAGGAGFAEKPFFESKPGAENAPGVDFT